MVGNEKRQFRCLVFFFLCHVPLATSHVSKKPIENSIATTQGVLQQEQGVAERAQLRDERAVHNSAGGSVPCAQTHGVLLHARGTTSQRTESIGTG